MRTRVWFSATLLLLVVTLLVQSAALSPASRMAPLWALLPTVLLLVVQLATDMSPGLAERLSFLRRPAVAVSERGVQATQETAEGSTPFGDRRSRELRLVLWLGWLIGLMYLVGFLLAAVLFLLPYLRTESGQGWGRSLVLACLATAVVYLVFGVAARVPFPPGILF